MVVPTMGAKGLLVALDDDFGKCTLTDDGVTVAKQAIHMDGLDRMIAVDMIEAAATTEKEALDGTTLTVLLTNEIYKYGYREILLGKHPQMVADKISSEIEEVRKELKKYSGEEITNANLPVIDSLSHAIKNIDKIIDKNEEEDGSYDYKMNRGGRRGYGRNVRRFSYHRCSKRRCCCRIF